MANITLSVSSPTEGSAWSVNFSVDGATIIRTIVGFGITCSTNTAASFSVPNTGSITNVVNGFSSHYGAGMPTNPAGSGADSYITWRSSTATSGQYPSSGRSMDIWSVDFYNDIMYTNGNYNKKWGDINNGSSYSLNPRKWSLIYDYSSRTAFVWSKGGILTVNVV